MNFPRRGIEWRNWRRWVISAIAAGTHWQIGFEPSPALGQLNIPRDVDKAVHSIYPKPEVQGRDAAALRIGGSRHGHAVLPLEKGWLVCGGFLAEPRLEDRGSHDAFWCDRQTLEWCELPRMNVGKAFFGAAVVGGQAYVVGGNIERFNPAAKRWEIVCRDSALPTSHFSAASIDSQLLIVAHRLFLFDTQTGTLTDRDLWPTRGPGDHFHVVAALGGELHVIGGLDGETFDSQREHWVWNGTQWRRLPDAPAALFAKFAVVQVVENRLYVLSADGSYFFEAGHWKTLARMPKAICMPGSLVNSGKIYVIGGLSTDPSLSRFVYDITNDRWSVD